MTHPKNQDPSHKQQHSASGNETGQQQEQSHVHQNQSQVQTVKLAVQIQ